MDKVENLEYWLVKFDLNLSFISQDIDIERISFLPVTQLTIDEKCHGTISS